MIHLCDKQFKLLNRLDPEHDLWRKGEHDVFVTEWATLKHIKEANSDSLEQMLGSVAENLLTENKLPELKPHPHKNFMNV